jgi:hypothetical protein
MAHITLHCTLCSSEILASGETPLPQVCLLCQLSAEEAVSALQEEQRMAFRPSTLLQNVRGRISADRVARFW